MSPLIFQKPALTIDRQIELLIQKGMLITNKTSAQYHLSHINYYRLRAYWLPFEIPNNSNAHKFYPETTFEKVLNT